jgi:glycosyltransferase-like protein
MPTDPPRIRPSDMRVALLTYSTKPRGGVVHTLALAEALARAGQSVTVVTLGRGGDATFFRDVDLAVGVHVVPFAGIDGESVGERILRSIRVLRAGFDPAGFDVVHAQDCISANAADDVVRTVHHLDTFTTPELVECHDRAVRDPQQLICVSQAVADEVAAGWGRHPVVIPNGVDAVSFAAAASTDAAAVAARAAWTAELGDYVLAVGGIEPRKGTIDLLEAFALVRRPGLRLVLAGGETLFDYSDYRRRFDETAARLEIEPLVLGAVPQSRMAPLVAAAAAVGFVSTKEGFGLAALEALAASRPVVARDLPVLREVFGDAVLFADDVPGIAAQLRRALDGGAPPPSVGRALARGYSWDTAAAAHVDVYRRLVGG